MDDDQNRTLDFNEFKKGIRDYGLYLEPKVICCHVACTKKIDITENFIYMYIFNTAQVYW